LPSGERYASFVRGFHGCQVACERKNGFGEAEEWNF
jgi:hypothetical protein